MTAEITTMKRTAIFAMALVLSIVQAVASTPDEGTPAATQQLTIKAPRFALPLVKRWIEEYSKVDASLSLEAVASPSAQADLTIVLEGSNPAVGKAFYFGEIAVLPFTAAGSEAEGVLKHTRGLNAKRLKELFFHADVAADRKPDKAFGQLTVYSGSQTQFSVAPLFAHSLGQESTELRGRRIAGDDIFLNMALQKDPKGVSFNALPNLFDLTTRQLQRGLALVTLDTRRQIAGGATLDQLIDQLEQDRPQEVAAGRVGLSFADDRDAVFRFLEWVLSEGSRWNHQYGLLNLSSKTAAAETARLRHLEASLK